MNGSDLTFETREIDGVMIQASVFAWQCYDNDYRGNGCGVDFTPFWLRRYGTKPVGCDLTTACVLHDAEYLVPLDDRTNEHFRECNKALRANLMVLCQKPLKSGWRKWLCKVSRSYRQFRNRVIDNLPNWYYSIVSSPVGHHYYWGE